MRLGCLSGSGLRHVLWHRPLQAFDDQLHVLSPCVMQDCVLGSPPGAAGHHHEMEVSSGYFQAYTYNMQPTNCGK